jgi:hypothetical protein
LAVATALTLLCLGLAACGGDDESRGAKVVPAAGDYAQTESTTGGASYDVTAAEWLKLSSSQRLKATKDYVDDNGDICDGADPSRVADYAEVSAGADYPLTSSMDELLAEGCAAVEQS